MTKMKRALGVQLRWIWSFRDKPMKLIYRAANLTLLLIAAASSISWAYANSSDNNNPAAWLIVVKNDMALEQLSQKQVMSFFLGRNHFLPDGGRVKTFDFPVDSPIRAQFYRTLTGRNIADIDAYWARLRYSGRASPPQKLPDGKAILQRISEQPSALGYVPSTFADNLADYGLKAVLTVGR